MFKQHQFISELLRRIVGAALIAVIAATIVTLLTDRIRKIATGLREQKILTLVLEQRNATAATLREQFTQIGTNDEAIKAAFLSTDNVLDFVNALETVALQNSMQSMIKFGTPGTATVGAGEFAVVPISYTITANGTVTTLLNYLKQAEALPYFAEVTSLSVSSGAIKGWDDASNILLQGIIHVRQNN